MTERGPYRRHPPEFKLRLCREIRSGQLGRRDAQKKYSLSDNLIQHWLAQFDQQTLPGQAAAPVAIDAYRDRIAALERKVGQLTMALDGLAPPRDSTDPEVRSPPPPADPDPV